MSPTCCGGPAVWVDNGPRLQYFYCQECKQEVGASSNELALTDIAALNGEDMDEFHNWIANNIDSADPWPSDIDWPTLQLRIEAEGLHPYPLISASDLNADFDALTEAHASCTNVVFDRSGMIQKRVGYSQLHNTIEQARALVVDDCPVYRERGSKIKRWYGINEVQPYIASQKIEEGDLVALNPNTGLLQKVLYDALTGESTFDLS